MAHAIAEYGACNTAKLPHNIKKWMRHSISYRLFEKS